MEHSKQEHYPWLDYLRAYAAIWVVFYHSPFNPLDSFINQWARFGSLGVDLFFVLSGFLISNQVFLELNGHQAFSLKRFYLKRIFRIWPNYFFMLLFFLVLGYGFNHESYQVKPLLSFFTLTQNFIVHEYFNVSWSLCIEEHFYIIFPLVIYVLTSKNVKPQNWIRFFFLLVGIEVIFRAHYWNLYRPDLSSSVEDFYKYFHNYTQVRFSGLVVGILIALIKYYHINVWESLKGKQILTFILSIVFLYTSISWLPKMSGHPYSFINILWSNLIISLGFGFLVITAININHRLWFPIHKFLTFTSLLSYSLYLTHPEVIKLFGTFIGHDRRYLFVMLFLVMVYVSSFLLYSLIEKPFMSFRKTLLSH